MSERKDGGHLAKCLVDDYDILLEKKVNKFQEMLVSVGCDNLPSIESFASHKEHFRMRANFQMWHDDPKNKHPDGFYYCMYDENDRRTPQEIKSFPRGTQRINTLMPLVMKACHEIPAIFNNLFEVRFVTTQSGQALVVLCYKKPIPDTWQAAAEQLAVQWDAKIIGRSRKVMKLAGGEDETVCEVLHINGRDFKLYQTEGAFSQPNAAVCEQMITWALNVTQSSNTFDLLELYCGGGTFTAPMSHNFRKVLATEISKASVELAKRAFRDNSITNIQMLRLSSEEFTRFYHGLDNFQRVQTSGVILSNYDLRTVLVDPPRAGLDEATCKLVASFQYIVYISCNPVTLVRDLQVLCKSHQIERVAAFDQFPYTHHLECGVYLTRRETEEKPDRQDREEEVEHSIKKQRVE
jgi:tRNA (uracil-5-)-methyltransferase